MLTKKHSKLNQIAVALVCSLLFAAIQGQTTARAAKISWQNKNYSHYARKEDIKDVLTDLFASHGIGVICSENVEGKISGNFKEKSPQDFFRHIMDAYNLVWYYDGVAVYVYGANEVTSQILNLQYLDMKKFRQHLIELGIYDPKFAMRMIENKRIIYLSGPQRYVELVTEIARQLDAKALIYGGMDDIVKIFPLKHAWADDKKIRFHDSEMVIPGVATMLNNLISGITRPGQVIDKNPGNLNTPLEKLKGRGLKRDRPKDQSDQSADAKTQKERHDPEKQKIRENDQNKNLPPPPETTGSVQADPRQNAVVVRDHGEKMPYYEEIIDLLDAPVNLVEIRATIMDIDRSDLHDLGIQWEFRSTNDAGDKVTKGGLNTDSLLPQTEEDGQLLPVGDRLQLPTGNGLNIATIVGDATNYFLAKVNALQEKGQAEILSRPSVLTLNNIEAQLEHSQTFYVKLEGEKEVDLYDISSGVVLRVTPHIITEEDQSLVKLAIQIEDGDLTGEQVDGIPIVKKSVINTQAMVGQQQSLLIGGYLKERNTTSSAGVPCLMDIPLLGWLFKRNSTVAEERERLFLITPTIVPYSAGSKIAGQGRKITRKDIAP
jgi:type III secretion protein C